MNDERPTRDEVLKHLEDQIERLEAEIETPQTLAPGRPFNPKTFERERLRMLEAAVIYIGAAAPAPTVMPPPNPELEALLLRIGRAAEAIRLDPPTRLERFLREFYSLPYVVRALFGFTMLALALNIIVDFLT